MNDDYTPELEPYSLKERIGLAVMILFLIVEISTMWTWCQWFTN